MNNAGWDTFFAHAKDAASAQVGVFAKDKVVGKFADEWGKVWAKAIEDNKWASLDVGPVFSAIWASKDDQEISFTRTAAKMSTLLLKDYFVDEMSNALDDGRKVSHEKLASLLENKLDDNSFWRKHKAVLPDLDPTYGDWCYTPIIMSGGEYDLRTSAQSDNKRLAGADGSGTVIIVEAGIRYRSYCSNIGRTYLVDPHEKQSEAYSLLLEAQQKIASDLLRPGVTGREVYNQAVEFIKSKNPDLVSHLTKSIGFATGLEFRDSAFLLSPRNERTIKRDMVFDLNLGVEHIPDPSHPGKTYALLLIDTVRVNADGPVTFLTTAIKSTSDLSFFQEKSDEEKPKAKPKPAKADDAVLESFTGRRLRSSNRTLNQEESVDNRIKEHQKELAKQKQEEGLARFGDDDAGENKSRGQVWKRFESYKGDHVVPSRAKDLKIFLDQRASSIIIPIYGFAVPFHIHTLKNLSKSDEGEWTYLRFNFISPGQILGKKEDQPFEDPDATFVRNMTFRSQDAYHFAELYKEITEFKKAATKREAEKKELADVVEQEKLVLNKQRPQVLREVFPRPALEGKRVPGDLEIHQNGIRFNSPLHQRVDLLFSNIKHLFFQPTDKELIVLVHVHLKHPIMVGKKKARDIQFFREASDVQFDETGNRKRKYRTGDDDEIELENEERRHRHQLNKEFKAFTQKIAEASRGRLEMDVPFRELAFNAVPHRSSVLVAPTMDALVHLSEPPFFVLTLAEVEIAHLERVQYGLKNFDLVFVLKDYSKPVVHLNSIPSQQLDSIKEWLDSVDMPISVGQVNLNWTAIMKTVQDDPSEFFRMGGWGFLQGGSDDEDASDESDPESDFSDAMGGDMGSNDDSSGAGSESDFDEDASDDSGSAASDASFDDEDEGEDWDTLERKAARADDRYRREHGDDSDDDRGGRSGGGRGAKKGAGAGAAAVKGKSAGAAAPGRRKW